MTKSLVLQFLEPGKADQTHGVEDSVFDALSVSPPPILQVDGGLFTYDDSAGNWVRYAETEIAVKIGAVVEGETYYTKGKDASWFEALNDKEFALQTTHASQDICDGDFSNVENYMPISAILSSAADRLNKRGSPNLGYATNIELDAEIAARREMGHTDPNYRPVD